MSDPMFDYAYSMLLESSLNAAIKCNSKNILDYLDKCLAWHLSKEQENAIAYEMDLKRVEGLRSWVYP